MSEQSLSRAEQDKVLLEIYALANHYAIDLVRSQHRDDVVHNLALDCLRQLRGHSWNVAPEKLDLYIRTRLIGRRTTAKRSRRRQLVRDAKYLMAADTASDGLVVQHNRLDADHLDRFTKRVRKTIRGECLRAHRLVRNEAMTYAEAGAKLGVPTQRIHEYVKTVQRAFRDALPTIGIEPPASTRGGRISSRQARRS